MRFAASAIQRVDVMSALGPQNLKRGNGPSSLCSASRRSAGCVQQSGIFRPSAGYAGRGVTVKSDEPYIANHQQTFALVNFGSRFFAASHTRSPATRCADCFQNATSARSRSYQPLPTTPWEDGASPVSIVACAEHVTAGSTGVIGATKPSFATAASRGACASSAGVRPTTFRTSSGRILPCGGDACVAPVVPLANGRGDAGVAPTRPERCGLFSVRKVDVVDPARDLGHQRHAVAGAAAAAERGARDVEVQ